MSWDVCTRELEIKALAKGTNLSNNYMYTYCTMKQNILPGFGVDEDARIQEFLEK